MSDDPQAHAVDGEILVEADGEALALSVDDAQLLRSEIDAVLDEVSDQPMTDRLQQVENVGSSAAERLEMKFGDMESLAEASSAEIETIQDVGRGRRMAIEKAVELYEQGEL